MFWQGLWSRVAWIETRQLVCLFAFPCALLPLGNEYDQIEFWMQHIIFQLSGNFCIRQLQINFHIDNSAAWKCVWILWSIAQIFLKHFFWFCSEDWNNFFPICFQIYRLIEKHNACSGKTIAGICQNVGHYYTAPHNPTQPRHTQTHPGENSEKIVN